MNKNLSKESEFTNKNPLCKETSLWSARDVQSAEDEVSNFIGALVRLLKPKVVVETGCWKGDTTIAIARAIKENGRGELYSCDIDPDLVKEAQEWLEREGLNAMITSQKGIELIDNFRVVDIDFAFIDSGDHKARAEEVMAVIPKLSPFGVLVLHDTAPQHGEMCRLAGSIPLNGIYLNTPRGLSVYIKAE